MRVVHYVGMTEATYQRARQVFGGPAYYHRVMDDRVWSEVGDDDMVVVDSWRHSPYVWDASAVSAEWTS